MSDSSVSEPPPSSRKRRSQKKERIAMVSTHGYVAANPPLGAPDTGGQVVYVVELSKKLAQLGYKVDIWTRQFEDQSQVEEVDDDVRIIRMPCGGKDFIAKEVLYKKLPEWTENALRYIREHELDYQFINSHYWDAGLAGQSLSNRLDVPHLHTPHSIGAWKKQNMERDSEKSPEELDRIYNFSRRIHHEQILYKECDMVVATSPLQLDLLKKDYGLEPEAMKMIPPGYDDNRFFPVSHATRDAIREQLGYKGLVVASIGRLSHNKGFDLLVDAFAVAAERVPYASLRLAVGSETDENVEDPQRQSLHEKVKEYGLEDRVTITDSLDDEEMADFYRAADVFCLPSRYEPFGMTAVEAMACGTPTLITTRGGLYRTMTFGWDAVYADSLDKYDFGITLNRLLKHRSIRRRLSDRGAHKVRSLFTWTGIAQQLLSLVEERVSQPLEVFEEEDGVH